MDDHDTVKKKNPNLSSGFHSIPPKAGACSVWRAGVDDSEK